jgi:tetratricopeptide (TPR) repeat protein
LRDFALEQVTSCDEGEAVGRGHARYFLEPVERAAPELVGPTQRAWFLRLEQEHGNLRAALRWLWDHGENEQGLRLAGAPGYFWEVRGYLREGQQAVDEALARVPGANPRLRARALNRLGSLFIWQGEAERSRVVLEEALALVRALEDPDIIARSLAQLGRQTANFGPPEEGMREAVQLLEEALALREQLEDRRGAAAIQTQLAWIALGQRAYEQAEELGQEALAAGEQDNTAHAVAFIRQGVEASSRLQDHLAEFARYGAVVLAVSTDHIWCHRAFARASGLHYPLLADAHPQGAVSRAYGMYDEQAGLSSRSLFVLDEHGIVRWSQTCPAAINPGIDGILTALESMGGEEAGA